MMSKRRRNKQAQLYVRYDEEFTHDGILYSVIHKLNDLIYAVAIKKGKKGMIAGGAVERFRNGELIPNPRKGKRKLSELNA